MTFDARIRLLMLCLLTAAGFASAEPREIGQAQVSAEQAYDVARQKYNANRSDPEVGWQFGRACFDRADNASTDDDRATVAKEGIDVCRNIIKHNPKLAAAHYYLGLNIAELARTRRLGALHLLREMEKEWTTTLALEPGLDYAGADRALGLLYRDAPGPPLSLGSYGKSLSHLQHALKLAPEYPENHINLIESYIKWRQIPEAQQAERVWLPLIAQEKKEFAGPAWRSSWEDWESRQVKIELRIGQPESKTALR